MSVLSPDALQERLQALIRPGDTLWWGQATAEPLTLTRAVVAHRHALARHGGQGRLRVFVGMGASDTLQPAHADAIDFFGYAAGGPHRALAQAGVLDILPSHYSHLPGLIDEGLLPADVVLLQVSPPDAQGRYSWAWSMNTCRPNRYTYRRVLIGEVNPAIPWTHGSLHLQAGDFALLVDAEHPPLDQARRRARPLPSRPLPAMWPPSSKTAPRCRWAWQPARGRARRPARPPRPGPAQRRPWATGIAALAEAGVLTHARKSQDRGVGIGGILMGGESLRRWAHRNPALQLRETRYTHDPEVLAASHRLAAINSAVEVDLTGQINSEVAGGRLRGRRGGRRGLSARRGTQPRRPAHHRPVRHGQGGTRIVARLSGPVSTPRSDAGLIVTEHGVADLRGQTLSRRVKRLIDIAAPEHRADLEQQAHTLLRQCGAAFS